METIQALGYSPLFDAKENYINQGRQIGRLLWEFILFCKMEWLI